MAPVIIQCPSCQIRLQIKQAGGQVKCSQCGQLIQIKQPAREQPAPQQSVTAPSSAFDSLPNIPASSTAPAFASSPQAKRNANPRKPINLKPFFIAGAVIGVGLLAALGIYIGSHALPEGALTNLNPLGDSHAAVIESALSLSDEMVGIYQSVDSRESCEASVSRVNDLTEQAEDLAQRAAKLHPMTDEEFRSMVEKLKSRGEETKKRSRETVQAFADKGYATDSFRTAAVRFGLAASRAMTVCKIAWLPLPEPTSEHERIDFELIELRRDLWRSMVLVDSESDYSELASTVAQRTEQAQDLLERKKQEHRETPSTKSSLNLGSPVGSLNFDVSFQIAEYTQTLKDKYGDNDKLAKGWSTIEQICSDFRGLVAQSGPQSHMRNQFADHGIHPPRIPSAIKNRGGGSSKNTMGQAGESRQSPNALGGSQNTLNPDSANASRTRKIETGARPGTESSRAEQNVHRFVAKNGPQNTVVIRTIHADGLRPGVLVKNLVSALGVQSFFATLPSDYAVMAVGFTGTVEEVEALIQWGKVTESDNANRIIYVDASQ